jgi:hypothetical protein
VSAKEDMFKTVPAKDIFKEHGFREFETVLQISWCLLRWVLMGWGCCGGWGINCSYGWYFTFFQGFVYLTIITCQGFGPKQVSNSWRTYVKLSAVLMGSQGLTKGCLMFINYPAQIMFKSTKVPTSDSSSSSTHVAHGETLQAV